MHRMSMNEMTTFRWSFEEDVHNYCEAGISAIGVWRQKLSDFGEERGQDLLHEMQLPVSNLMWAGGFTGSEGHTHRESIQDAIEAVQLAADLGAPCLVVYSGSRGGHTSNHAKRLLISALKEITPLAAELNVRLAIEPMHGSCAAGWTFLTNLDQTVSLLEEVGSPQLGFVFDTYHLAWNPGVIERIPKLVDQIAIVQLADGRPPVDSEQIRTRLGEGQLPLVDTIAALVSAGYAGDYDVEILGPEFDPTGYRELLRHSSEMFERLLQLATRSATAFDPTV
ncbi:MAG: sugar phosphate isomerase/epimerase family protein [Planctomycetota bacterium]|nr:sugar phosphate isomerase/epimerase family protein [Planctomycetota bacterium]